MTIYIPAWNEVEMTLDLTLDCICRGVLVPVAVALWMEARKPRTSVQFPRTNWTLRNIEIGWCRHRSVLTHRHTMPKRTVCALAWQAVEEDPAADGHFVVLAAYDVTCDEVLLRDSNPKKCAHAHTPRAHMRISHAHTCARAHTAHTTAVAAWWRGCNLLAAGCCRHCRPRRCWCLPAAHRSAQSAAAARAGT